MEMMDGRLGTHNHQCCYFACMSLTLFGPAGCQWLFIFLLFFFALFSVDGIDVSELCGSDSEADIPDDG